MNNMLNGAITSTISPWGIKIRHPYEQYVAWGEKSINFISMRDQNLPPPLNNIFNGVITSSISPWGIKIRHPYEHYFGWGNNINYIFMRDQIRQPYEQYVAWGEKHQL